MELTVPVYAKALAALRERRRRNADAAAARAASTPSRLPGFLFRRAEPVSTFQRCLAVHMHFAQHHSALD